MWNLLRLPFAALFATAIVFLWGMFSWTRFDWHDTTIHKFTDEAAVAEVLRQNAPKPGMYQLPSDEDLDLNDQATAKAFQSKQNAGPFFFGAVRGGPMPGHHSMERTQYVYLGSVFASAIVMGLILWMAGIRTYLGRVGFVMLMALFASLVTHIPYWTWFEFSSGHTLASIGDTLVGWTAAGFALATLIWPSDS